VAGRGNVVGGVGDALGFRAGMHVRRVVLGEWGDGTCAYFLGDSNWDTAGGTDAQMSEAENEVGGDRCQPNGLRDGQGSRGEERIQEWT
jgi:hypothetical protein